MGQSGRGSVLCSANSEMFSNALAEKFIDGRHAGFAVEFDETVFFCHGFEFAFDHRLIADERPVQIVRERHIASRFPIADGLGFPKFAAEGGFGANVEPEGLMGAQGHGVEAAEVIAIDSADNTARDQSENVTVGENYGAGF